MFLKMFKRSLKGTFKVALILSIALVVGFTLLGVAFALMGVETNSPTQTSLVSVAGVSILYITLFAVSLIPTGFTIYLLIGTHLDFTTDKAYFTFTIPIKPKDLILSKSLAIFVQFLMLYLAQIIGVITMIFIIGLSTGVSLAEFITELGLFIKALSTIITLTGNFWDVVCVIEILIIIALIYAVAILATVLIAVLVLNNKKKLFLALGIIFGGGYILSVVSMVLLAYVTETFFMIGELTTLSLQILFITAIVFLIVALFGIYKWAEVKISKGVNLN